jgi:polyisoprenoid-binding protein YceI
MKIRSSYIALLLVTFSLFSVNTFAAEWQIDPTNSQLSFISIKKINVAETHYFRNLQGSVDSHGQLTLAIDLASVDTNITVRDERMIEFLFETDVFTTATVSATIDTSEIDAIAEGASARLIISAVLDLHGEKQPLKMDVIVTRLVGAKLSVVSVQPVILNLSDYSLVSGVEKLRELAKLPTISHAVPVSFYLIFKLKQG